MTEEKSETVPSGDLNMLLKVISQSFKENCVVLHDCSQTYSLLGLFLLSVLWLLMVRGGLRRKNVSVRRQFTRAEMNIKHLLLYVILIVSQSLVILITAGCKNKSAV